MRIMTTPEPPDLVAMMTAAEIEWLENAPEDWTEIVFVAGQGAFIARPGSSPVILAGTRSTSSTCRRRLVRMWEKDGVAAFRDLSASLKNKPTVRK